MARSKDRAQVKEEGDVVVGLFQDRPSAEAAIQRLKAAGFSELEIGVAVRDREQQDTITEGTGTQAADGAAKGAVGGGVVGGAVGLLAGVGALVIPGVGPIIAGGWLASTLAGAGIGAAAGGLIGALVGMGVPEEDAKHFERGFQEGGILVTVQAGEDAEEAREALSEDGADLGPSWSGYGEYEEDEDSDETEETEDGARIELMEEELDEASVGKGRVQGTRTVSESVLREEARIESEGDVRMGSYAGGERRRAGSTQYRGQERRIASQR